MAGQAAPPVYRTRYPRTMVLEGGAQSSARAGAGGLDQMYVEACSGEGELFGALRREGFTAVRFEHRRPGQVGRGMSLRLAGSWEMHLRASRAGGRLLVHAEVEVSRDYMQHLFTQRTPVVYEVVRILERHGIESHIWDPRHRRRVESVVDRWRVSLQPPVLPPLAWKPLVYSIGAIGILYLAKYLATV